MAGPGPAILFQAINTLHYAEYRLAGWRARRVPEGGAAMVNGGTSVDSVDTP
jgi:hypothetical protein